MYMGQSHLKMQEKNYCVCTCELVFADYKPCYLALAFFISLSWMCYTECQMSIFVYPTRQLFMALMKCLCGGVHALVLQLTYVDPLAIALHQQQDKHVKGNKVDDEHITTPC